MRRAAFRVLVAALVLAGAGCSRPKIVRTEQQRAEVERNILEVLPPEPGLVRLDANFDDQVTLLGYVLSSDRLKPGEPVTITLYWRCDRTVDGDMRIFVHLDSQKRSTFDHDAVSGLLPAREWEPGQIIQDVLTLDVDRGYPEGAARLWVGFYDETLYRERKQDERLPLKDPGKGRRDWEKSGRDRLLVATLWVGKGTPTGVVVHRAGSIVVDGKLDEPAWGKALADVGPLKRIQGGAAVPAGAGARAGFLWDDDYLYVAWSVEDRDVRSTLTARDDRLWTMDNVELFLRADPAVGGPYLELQVAPTGAIFDAAFVGHQTPAWGKAAAALTMDVEAAVQADGTLNDPAPDTGWTAEVAIPFRELPGVGGPPAEGTRWSANLYRISGGNGSEALTWVPAGGDFHNLINVGVLTFSTKLALPDARTMEVERNLLKELPKVAGLVPVDANFANKVTLLGYQLSPDRLKPGGRSTITFYWRCDAALPGEWKIFVHLDGRTKRAVFDHDAIAGLHPVRAWKPGQIVRDVVPLSVDRNFPEGPAKLWAGFFDVAATKENLDAKLTVKDPGKGSQDAAGRLLVATLSVDEAAAEAPP